MWIAIEAKHIPGKIVDCCDSGNAGAERTKSKLISPMRMNEGRRLGPDDSPKITDLGPVICAGKMTFAKWTDKDAQASKPIDLFLRKSFAQRVKRNLVAAID